MDVPGGQRLRRPDRMVLPASSRRSDFGVEVEEGVEGVLELGFDTFAGAFEDVHRDLCFVAVVEDDGRGLDARDFVGGQETHTVDQD